jgi:hypothetical protein
MGSSPNRSKYASKLFFFTCVHLFSNKTKQNNITQNNKTKQKQNNTTKPKQKRTKQTG